MSDKRVLTRSEIARQRRAQRAAKELTQTSKRALNPVLPVSRVTPTYTVVSHKSATNQRSFKIALGLPEIHLHKPSISVQRLHASWRLGSVFIALLLSTAIYLALTLPYFHVPSATVLGNNRLSRDEIESVLGVLGQSIFTVKPDEVETRLRMNYPELLSAQVNVYLPNYVYVTVTERQPVILWQQDGGYTWIDATGVAFRPRGSVAGLVSVTGLAVPPAGVPSLDDPISAPPYMQKELVDAILALAPTVPVDTTMVFDRSFGLGWTDSRGWKSFFGTSAQDMPLKVRVYQSLVDSLASRGVTPIFINVMYPDAPFYRAVKVELDSLQWIADNKQMDEIVVGIDVGTTKVCTLVGRVDEAKSIRILGVGIEPSDGIRKGIIVDLAAASKAIKRSVEKAEHTSGLEITTALVSLAGAHVSSVNSRGATGVPGGIIDATDIARAFEQAQAVAIPYDREIVHVIQRGMTVDGQEGVRTPIGMHGYKIEVETHIITAAGATVDNLRQCVGAAGVQIQQFVLNPLASAEVVLTEQERQMGVAVCDIGGGTTDLAIYVNGDVWHTMVLAVGGNHVTQDIAHGLRLPMSQAEDVKKQQGHALRSEIGSEEYFSIRPFGEDHDVRINRQDLAHIIEARVEETFDLIMQEVKRSGYDGLLPAGMVLTGGTSALPGIKRVASEVLGMSVRTAQPDNLTGLIDKLGSPAYSTSVGLLRWASTMREHDILVSSDNKNRRRSRGDKSMNFDSIKNLVKRILP